MHPSVKKELSQHKVDPSPTPDATPLWEAIACVRDRSCLRWMAAPWLDSPPPPANSISTSALPSSIYFILTKSGK